MLKRVCATTLSILAVVSSACSADGAKQSVPFLPPNTASEDPATVAVDAGASAPGPAPEGPHEVDPAPVLDAGLSTGTMPDAALSAQPDATAATEPMVAEDAGAYDPASSNPWSIPRERVPQDHNWCLASGLVLPGHYAGDMGSNSNDYANPDRCGDGLPTDGRDAWVKVGVPTGKTLSVWGNVKETGDFDAVLFVLHGSCGKLGTCVAGANDNLASREHTEWTNDTGADATVDVVFDLLLPPEKMNESIPYYLDINLR